MVTTPSAPRALPLPALAGWCLLLVGVIYGRALGHDLVHDDRLLLAGPRVADLSTLPQALVEDLFWLAGGEVRPSPYWRPVVVASYYLEHALWGPGSAARLTNLLAVGLLGLLVGRRAASPLGALGAATLVIAHPMQVEAAVNITARTDLFAALFGTLAVLRGGVLGAALTALALGSKEVAVVVPVLALLRARLAGEGPRAWVPHLVTTGAWLGGRQVLVGSWGVAAEDLGGPSAEGLLHLGSRLLFYLGRLVLPVDPVAARTLPPPAVMLDLGGLVLLAVVAGLALWRRPWPSAEVRLGLSILVLPLVPVCGLLSAQVRYAEGFLSWPLVGLGMLVGAAPRRAAGALLAVALVASVGAARHVPAWQDEATLWEDAWRRLPGDPLVGLKVARTRVGRPEADPWPPLRAALAGETDPRRLREAHALAAHLLIGAGRDQDALVHLRVAADPDDAEAGWALVSRCVLEVAAGEEQPGLQPVCEAALRLRPDDPDLQNAAGIEAARRGDLAVATRRFERAVSLDPTRPAFRDNLERARGATP